MPLDAEYGGAGAGPKGDKGDPGDPGATGATGPSKVIVKVDATLTTSGGTITVVCDQGRLAADLVLSANAIQIFFGAGYGTSNAYWTWQPGYVTPGTPGSFTAIGSGRSNQSVAVSRFSVETYSHSGVTIPAGSIPAVQCIPTNFPSTAAYGDHFFYFGNV